LMLFIKNEFRHYYAELKSDNWGKYFKCLYIELLLHSIIYILLVNIIFYFIFDGTLSLFSIHIFNILTVSNILMGLASLVQARLFSLGKLQDFFTISVMISLLRVSFMTIAGIYLINPYFIVYAELFSTLIVILFIIYKKLLPKISFNNSKTIYLKKSSGITDGLSITVYNIYSYILFYYASMIIASSYFLIFFATYRITRPLINLGSLFPNYILKNKIEDQKKFLNMFFYLLVAALTLLFMQYSGILPLIINFLAEDIVYDSNVYYLLIMIGLISWVNGLLAGNYMRIFNTSSGLLYAMLIASLLSFIFFIYTQQLIMSIALFEISNFILISYITKIEKKS